MKCQVCQERPAVLHVKQLVNGEETVLHLCSVCAQDKGYTSLGSSEESYSLHDLLTGLFNYENIPFPQTQNTQPNQQQELTCPDCGMTFSQFKQVGKFGCATCYETFSTRLDPILKRVHAGNTQHFGKVPKRGGTAIQVRKQLEMYREELKSLIEAEEFEEAAIMRDKIRSLEKGRQEPEEGDPS